MSWLFSQALVEEYLGDISLDGEQSVQSSGKPTQQAYCAPDKMTKYSRLSRFGMMFKPLTESHGKELLMSYLEDFRVKTLAQQEQEVELKVNDLDCGEKWHGSFTKLDQDTLLWKTHQCSLLEDLELFSQTWPESGTMLNGECWERQTLELDTKETEFGSLPNGVDFFHTPNTTGLDGGSNSRKALKKRMEQWPTPDANCGKRGTQPEWTPKRKSGHPAQYTINQAVRDRFPTPQASDNRDRGNMSSPSVKRRLQIGKQVSLGQSVSETSGKLNPMWVEWLMGWPMQWTDLKPLEMDKYPYVQQQHGNY